MNRELPRSTDRNNVEYLEIMQSGIVFHTVWECGIIRFIGFMILWNIVDILLDVIFNRV